MMTHGVRHNDVSSMLDSILLRGMYSQIPLFSMGLLKSVWRLWFGTLRAFAIDARSETYRM
jgi:hypothetical protein